MIQLRRMTGALLACLAILALAAPTAGADHAGEVVELSKSEGLTDGETVTITWSGFQPGVQANIMVVGEFPIATIPTRMNMEEFGQFTAPTDDTGAGSTEYQVVKDHGTDTTGAPLVCGADTQCWVVVQQVPFTEGWYNGVEITFADDAPAETTTTTEAVEETTTTEAETTTTTESNVSDEVVTTTDESDDDDGSNTGLIIGIVAAVVVLGGGAAYALNKRKNDGQPT